jgi:DNA-binding NarL/FixJ family response regulator
LSQTSDANLLGAIISNPASEAVRSKKKLRIVLVDDHAVVRRGLVGLFRTEPDIEIVGEACDGESAVYLIREVQPDFALMDVNMPGMSGIQATRIIHSELPRVRIIGLSMFQTEELSAAMQEAGAVDYVCKSAPFEAIIAAIRACA